MYTVLSAGGLGVIGGLRYTPKMLRSQIQRLKASLNDPKAPFGVDLLFPQVGGNARRTVRWFRDTLSQLKVLIEVETLLQRIKELRLYKRSSRWVDSGYYWWRCKAVSLGFGILVHELNVWSLEKVRLRCGCTTSRSCRKASQTRNISHECKLMPLGSLGAVVLTFP